MIRGNDAQGIIAKQYLLQHFQTKELGSLQCFLGFKMARSKEGIFLYQRKNALDILSEAAFLRCRVVDTPMNTNAKLLPNQGDDLVNPGTYQRLIEK